jgi:exodeoxyribonuclease VII small subunit
MLTFENALSEINTLLTRLENPNTPLSELAETNQRITFLLDFCQKALRSANTPTE